VNSSKKTIKSARKVSDGFCPSYRVEYNEFDGSYFVSEPEYKLQRYVEKLLLERTVLPDEIEELLDLHGDLVNYDRSMEECD
jgi:hypothetical protein